MPQEYAEVKRVSSLINLYVGFMNQTQVTGLAWHDFKFLYIYNTQCVCSQSFPPLTFNCYTLFHNTD